MNNKILLLITLCIAAVTSATAKSPKWEKKVKPAQVSVITYNEKGEMHEGQGVFIDAQGTVITEYDIMKGAVKALVVDKSGKEIPVTEVCGASSMYNIAKLKTDIGKMKIAYLAPAQNPSDVNGLAYILPNVKADKNVPCTVDTITKVDTFKDSYSYYSLTGAFNERQFCSPVVNEQGQMIGLMQLPTKDGTNAYAIDCRFAAEMSISPMDATSTDLRSIKIRKSLPEKEEDAASYIFLVGKRDTAQYIAYVNTFIEQFPQNTSGYVMKGEYYVEQNNLEEAENVYETAIAQSGVKVDEIHYSWSKAIYQLNLTPKYEVFKDWNMEKALDEARKAKDVNPLPVYTHQEANCLYVLKKYDEACDKFLTLTSTNLRTPEIFLYAAQCKQMGEKPIEEALALMDSAVNCFTKPYPVNAASTLLVRASTLAQAGKNREAISDYNEYEHLMGNNLTANFYYEREQLEIKCRMYPAALNDIERAIRLAPQEPVLYAEAAALNYRVNQFDDAISYAQKAIELDQSFSDPHRILGVICIQQGKKEEAKTHLKKAVELGDPLAQGVLDKME